MQDFIDKENYGEISTITGRYYAMDRDKRWDRVKIAYDGICGGIGEHSTNYIEKIDDRYSKGKDLLLTLKV
jgi:2,3-bisphosphoglycerate-independent phosphoglycerate mutase